jgi:hypothetical protein
MHGQRHPGRRFSAPGPDSFGRSGVAGMVQGFEIETVRHVRVAESCLSLYRMQRGWCTSLLSAAHSTAHATLRLWLPGSAGLFGFDWESAKVPRHVGVCRPGLPGHAYYQANIDSFHGHSAIGYKGHYAEWLITGCKESTSVEAGYECTLHSEMNR